MRWKWSRNVCVRQSWPRLLTKRDSVRGRGMIQDNYQISSLGWQGRWGTSTEKAKKGRWTSWNDDFGVGLYRLSFRDLWNITWRYLVNHCFHISEAQEIGLFGSKLSQDQQDGCDLIHFHSQSQSERADRMRWTKDSGRKQGSPFYQLFILPSFLWALCKVRLIWFIIPST